MLARESDPLRPGSVELLGMGVLGPPTLEHQPRDQREKPSGHLIPSHSQILVIHYVSQLHPQVAVCTPLPKVHTGYSSACFTVTSDWCPP